MLQISLLCIGNLKERYWREACAEYEKRLQGFCKLSIVECTETKIADNPSPAQIAQVVESEGKRLLSRLPSAGAVLPLCIEGKQLSSEGLSALLDQYALEGTSTVSFVIGGSHGLSDAVKARGNLRLSMSGMTFPHQLARVMLLEQIYRAFQISRGAKYHK